MPRNLTLQFALFAVAAFALSGCLAQSQIQAKYMNKENDCRNDAENKAYEAHQQYEESRATNPPPPAPQPGPGQAVAATPQFDQSYTMGAAFSECMNKAGWKVTVPKPPGGPGPIVAAGTTTPPPSGAPGPGGVVALKGNPALQPSTVQPGTTQPAPAAAKAAAPQQPVQEAPAAAPILGPGVQPAPATVFKDPTPVQSGVGTYQPSVGRNF